MEAHIGEDEEAYLQTSLELVAAAREAGPEALVALADTLRGQALDLAMDEIAEAQAFLYESASPPPDTSPVTTEAEAESLASQLAIEAANRARAFASLQDSEEGLTDNPITIQQPLLPAVPAADLTVGSGCTYPTIAAAITAANPNDRLLIEGGVTFTENIIIDKNLTLIGGHSGCASGSTDRTIIDGNAADRIFEHCFRCKCDHAKSQSNQW